MPSMLSPAHASEVESSPANSAASGAFAPGNMAGLRTIAPQRPSLIRSIVRRNELSSMGFPRVYRRQNRTGRVVNLYLACALVQAPSLRVQLLVQPEQT